VECDFAKVGEVKCVLFEILAYIHKIFGTPGLGKDNLGRFLIPLSTKYVRIRVDTLYIFIVNQDI